MKRLALSALFVILAAAIPASATTVNLLLTGATGPGQGGVITYPYEVSINGAPSINVACDDYFGTESVGDSWAAVINTYNSNGTVTGGLFSGFANATRLYDEAAYLFTKMLSDPSDSANINFAIWGLFDSAATTAPGYTADSATWAVNANTWYTTPGDVSAFNFSGFEIFTPATGSYWTEGEPQEFITEKTPEPGAILMLGIGLVALALFAGRRNFPRPVEQANNA